jgi:hypothetical protein
MNSFQDRVSKYEKQLNEIELQIDNLRHDVEVEKHCLLNYSNLYEGEAIFIRRKIDAINDRIAQLLIDKNALIIQYKSYNATFRCSV